MCAKAREELLRPGLSGGGGGKPLEATAAAGAGDATFCTATTALGAPLSAGETDGFALIFTSCLDAALAATGAVVFNFAAGLAAGFALAAGATAFLTGFKTALATGLLAAFLGATLVVGAFFSAVCLGADFTAFLATTAAFVLDLTGAGAAFAFAIGFATGLAAFFGRAADFFFGWAAGLPAALAVVFTAGLAVVFDFLICAFTACLLWEAALWYARA